MNNRDKFKSILVSKVYTVVLPLLASIVLAPQFAFSQVRCESIFTVPVAAKSHLQLASGVKQTGHGSDQKTSVADTTRSISPFIQRNTSILMGQTNHVAESARELGLGEVAAEIATLNRSLKSTTLSLPRYRQISRRIIELAENVEIERAEQKNPQRGRYLSDEAGVRKYNLTQMKNDEAQLDQISRQASARGLRNLKFIETSLDINEAQLMRMIADGFFPIGVSTKELIVDGLRMTPGRFFSHDVLHARIFLSALTDLAKIRKVSLQETFNKFSVRVNRLLEMFQGEKDATLRKQLEWILFYHGHDSFSAATWDHLIFGEKLDASELERIDWDFNRFADKSLREEVRSKGQPWDKAIDLYMEYHSKLN